MQRPFVVGLRVATGAALVIGFLLIQMAISTRRVATAGTAYALTPRRRRVQCRSVRPLANPRPHRRWSVKRVSRRAPQPPGANLPVGATSATSQQTSDQMAGVAQVPSIPVDAKTQQITLLASQFNQLVHQWQNAERRARYASGAARDCHAGAEPGPAADAAGSDQPFPLAAVQPTPPVVTNPSAPSAASTPDQLRTQISGVAQQMAQVSQDASIPVDLKTAQLNNLPASSTS